VSPAVLAARLFRHLHIRAGPRCQVWISADCRHRSAADAELHAYLQQVAVTSRARFKAALEHVALHEGLILPTRPP
jgi:hypothetical protein